MPDVLPETYQIMRQTRAHEGSVFTLCSLHGGALLSGGGKDRKIIRWSVDLAPEQECEVITHSSDTVQVVVFHRRLQAESCFSIKKNQIPDNFGAVRTIADVDGQELLVGTTRNAILIGTISEGFRAIVQVDYRTIASNSQ